MTFETSGFQWRSQTAFVLVAAGATLSLNDFLTFPVLAGENGGGAFLLLYTFFLFAMGLPLLIAELLLGRMGRADPVQSFDKLAQSFHASHAWQLVGFFSMLAALLIVASFSVIAGWSLAYFFKSALGAFNQVTADSATSLFSDFIADAERLMLWHTLFILLLISIAAQNLRSGIERMSLILVPGMMLLLAVGLISAMLSPGLDQSIRYILDIDFSALDSSTPILALQRAFYTLALGAGVMIAYGRYLPRQVSIGYSALLVITIDLLFSILVGLSISAFIFTADIEPGLDNQFAFMVLPVVFAQFQLGQLFAALFFLLLTIASLTTTMALIEAPVCYLQRRFQFSRLKSVIFCGLVVWIVGFGAILSYTIWEGQGFSIELYFSNEAVRLVNNAGFREVIVYLSSHLLQPLAALLLCLFVAWVIPRQVSFRALRMGRINFEIWNYLVRFIVPVLLLVVALGASGII